MKKDKGIGHVFGIQQEDMAMLLQVSRSAWSMYAIGIRNLPVGVKLKVAKMLAFVKKIENENKDTIPPVKKLESKIKKSLQEQLVVNKYKQGRVAANLKDYQEKYESACRAYQLVEFLAAEPQESKNEGEILQEIKSKAEAAIEKNGSHIQEKYEIKLLVLQHEELLLKERLSR